MKLDTNTKTYTPNDAAADKCGKNPTFFSKYILRELPQDDVDPENDEDFFSQELNEVLSLSEQKPDNYMTDAPLKLKDEQFPRILFLGTGAADSYLLRNSSAVLVHIS